MSGNLSWPPASSRVLKSYNKLDSSADRDGGIELDNLSVEPKLPGKHSGANKFHRRDNLEEGVSGESHRTPHPFPRVPTYAYDTFGT
ncbi:hypothetical protein EPR50_G00016060 [Perca flavescens]|uniref:Uncharacterized protein n=1 Tax=Perca flavescens TaxID=8167 RepID=A0A484DKW9_PERFV|nr:hypothetical protein EPR50_G00016060 [Perca flavescens]